MKKLLFTLLCCTFFLTASADNDPKVGDILTVNSPTNQNFSHIDFPKANILIKRGVVTQYKSVINETVVISEVTTDNNGSTTVVLKKKDGTKFFGILSKVKADYTKAISSGELKIRK